MTDITEDGKYFSGFDGRIHDSSGHDFYVDDGLWDTYRSMHPLQLLIEPERQQDMIRFLPPHVRAKRLAAFFSVRGGGNGR